MNFIVRKDSTHFIQFKVSDKIAAKPELRGTHLAKYYFKFEAKPSPP
jgi:hypothetical protein